MPLITKILKPEKFTAETLAGYMLVGAELGSVPGWLRTVVIDAVQFALDAMRGKGIIGE